jgi:hypothetical protein
MTPFISLRGSVYRVHLLRVVSLSLSRQVLGFLPIRQQVS